MSQTIDICATDGTGFKLLDYRWLARFNRGREIRVVSVMDMVYQVLGNANQCKARVLNLYVNGHGASGYQSVGAGTNYDVSGTRSIQLDKDDFYAEPSLKGIAANIGLIELDGIWADGGMVTFLGCKVADGPDGKNMISAAAKTMGVWVRACDATQYSWLPGYEGQVWYSDPYGTIYRGTELYR